MTSLPATTKLGQGNKFTGVCLSTGGRGVPGLVPGGCLKFLGFGNFWGVSEIFVVGCLKCSRGSEILGGV